MAPPNLELPRRSPFQNEGLKSHLTRSNPSRANVYALIDAEFSLGRVRQLFELCTCVIFTSIHMYHANHPVYISHIVCLHDL